MNTSVDVDESIIPNHSSSIVNLINYPNPFNPTTTINFSLPEDCNVGLSIYNVKGQKVKALTNEFLVKGLHSIEWNGKDNNNKSVSSGIYFYQLNIDNKPVSNNKMLLIE
jgi:flagellar hook assembly protein FlgD